MGLRERWIERVGIVKRRQEEEENRDERMDKRKSDTGRTSKDGARGLKCASRRVCDGLLLHGAQLTQQTDSDSNLKTNSTNSASMLLIQSVSTHTHGDRTTQVSL